MSEFLKIAYELNKVKDLHESFIEYPVEEEYSLQDEDYIKKEDIEDKK